jgi:homoserine kinase type II
VDHSAFAASIPDVLDQFGLRLEGEATPVPGGSLNWNYRVETDHGPRFLRRYRDDLEIARIRGEHGLVTWAAARGVPAVRPSGVRSGRTVAVVAGGRWALFPWVEGAPVERGHLSPEQARALGSVHGRIQAALAEHPLSEDAVMKLHWDRDESLALLGAVETAALKADAEEWILAGIRKQRAMLAALELAPPEAFAALPCQLLHGDFHDEQVLWDGDRVSAVVDWEIWHTDPRAWELVRSLAFSQLLESPLLEEYLAGYRQHVRLSEYECRLALKLWWQSRVVGLWVWAAYFIERNERVRKVFPSVIADLELVSDPARRAAIEERLLSAALAVYSNLREVRARG